MMSLFGSLGRVTASLRTRTSLTHRPALLMASKQPFSASDFVVQHDPKKQKFVIKLEDDSTAFINYETLSNDEVLLYHTEVPQTYGGRGLGKILAKNAFDHFENNGQKMVITCTYLQKLDKQRKK